MTEPYRNLSSLIEENNEAGRYYASLPSAVKDTVWNSAEHIYSFEELRKCVENSLQ